MELVIRHYALGTVTVLIDETDADLAERSWSLAGGTRPPGEYAHGATGYLHRIVAQRMGLIPDVIDGNGPRHRVAIDHVNSNKLDNRRSNLRLIDRSSQSRNLNDGLRETNSSGHRGVSYDRSSRGRIKRWQAYATLNYVRKNLGYYATAEEAAEARRRWDEQHPA
jgi:hypothetical protein